MNKQKIQSNNVMEECQSQWSVINVSSSKDDYTFIPLENPTTGLADIESILIDWLDMIYLFFLYFLFIF